MQIICRCKYCRHYAINTQEESPCLQIDNYEEVISFVCTNKQCKKENKIVMGNFQENARKPLPGILNC